MLYLIRTFGRGKNKTALKVGYAKEIGERLKTYYHHNPFFEFISSRPGELYDELVIHLYLQAGGLKLGILNEWFLDRDEVLQEFHENQSKMLRVIWNNRNTLFSVADFKKSGNELKRRLYEDLRMTRYKDSDCKEIDKIWKTEMNKELLKKMRDDAYDRNVSGFRGSV